MNARMFEDFGSYNAESWRGAQEAHFLAELAADQAIRINGQRKGGADLGGSGPPEPNERDLQATEAVMPFLDFDPDAPGVDPDVLGAVAMQAVVAPQAGGVKTFLQTVPPALSAAGR